MQYPADNLKLDVPMNLQFFKILLVTAAIVIITACTGEFTVRVGQATSGATSTESPSTFSIEIEALDSDSPDLVLLDGDITISGIEVADIDGIPVSVAISQATASPEPTPTVESIATPASDTDLPRRPLPPIISVLRLAVPWV
jgi:hypothetical protein